MTDKTTNQSDPTLAKMKGNFKLPTTILPMQCPQGHRRDCVNKKTCMYRHIGERVGDQIKDVVDQSIRNDTKLSPMKKARAVIDRRREKEQCENQNHQSSSNRNREPKFHVAGLRNTDGNSCYINAVMQGLSSLHPFTQKLLQNQPDEEQKITAQLQNLINVMKSGEEKCINPYKMVEQIKRTSSCRFGSGRQEEFALYLRGRLQEEEIREQLEMTQSESRAARKKHEDNSVIK